MTDVHIHAVKSVSKQFLSQAATALPSSPLIVTSPTSLEHSS